MGADDGALEESWLPFLANPTAHKSKILFGLKVFCAYHFCFQTCPGCKRIVAFFTAKELQQDGVDFEADFGGQRKKA